jgi:prepilin signal peptidase PulO-like enzyme (type II secretory pathway)
MTTVLVFVIVYLSLVTAFVIWREQRKPIFVIPAGASLILPSTCPKCAHDLSVKFEKDALGRWGQQGPTE